MQTADRINQIKPSYIREILKAAQAPGMLSLAGGLPSEQHFPMQLIQQAMTYIAATSQNFQYAETKGYPKLRETLCEGLDKQFPQINADNILLTTGSQQALDLICRAYLNPGDTVIMESPCYLGALQCFKLAQAQIQTVTQDEQGPDLNQLETALINSSAKLFYAVPDFHNPTGLRWSKQRRQEVAELLERYQVTLIEDAPYRAICFDGEPLPTVSEFLQGNSFYLGSFSKIAAPAIRVGYVACSDTLIRPLEMIQQASVLHSALPMQQLAYQLIIAPEFQTHLQGVISAYNQRQKTMADQLKQQLGAKLSFTEATGGMFLWAKLTEDRAQDVAKKALQHKVAVVPGDVFWPNEKAEYQALRLNFSHTNKTDCCEAITRLSQCF